MISKQGNYSYSHRAVVLWLHSRFTGLREKVRRNVAEGNKREKKRENRKLKMKKILNLVTYPHHLKQRMRKKIRYNK